MRRTLGDYLLILRSKNVRTLVVSSCLLSFMRGPLAWLFPILLLRAGGPLFLGVAFAVANVDDTVMSLVGGVMADRWGRRPVLLLSRLMYVCGACLLLASMFVGGALSQAVLFVAVLFVYGMSGVSPGASSALLVESVEPRHVGQAFSLLSSSSLLFRSLGSAALGVIYQRSAVAGAFMLILFALISTLLLFSVRETLRSESVRHGERIVGHFVTTFRSIGHLGLLGLTPLLLLVVGNGLGHGVAGNYFAPLLEEVHGVSLAVLGGVFSAIPLLQAILVLPAGWLVDKRGPFLALMIGNVVAGGWVVLLGVTRCADLAVAAVVVSGSLGALHGIGYQTAVARLSSDRMRATLFGSLETLWNAMFIVGPLAGGALYGLQSQLTFIAAGTILLLTFLPILAMRCHAGQSGKSRRGGESSR